jgi:hypothetical protein
MKTASLQDLIVIGEFCVSAANTQVETLKWLTNQPHVDPQHREAFQSLIARRESVFEKIEAVLAAAKADEQG